MQDNDVYQIHRNSKRILNHMDVISEKLKRLSNSAYSPALSDMVPLIEFHPSDYCNLLCTWCTYAEGRKKIHFPFSELGKITQFNPRAIVIVGGGEPTLYGDGSKRFDDLINFLFERIPGLKIGIVTNGEIIPAGDWQKHVDWLRISVDAATQETYNREKRGDLEKRLKNLVNYLTGPIPTVSAGFIYNVGNIEEIADALHLIFTYVVENAGANYLNRVNVQYRPTCPIASCECPSPHYKTAKLLVPDFDVSWKKSATNQVSKIEQMKMKDPLFAKFVEYNSNYRVVNKTETLNKLDMFHTCSLALVRWLLRANGDVFPCVMKASNETSKMGNILTDKKEDLIRGMYSFYKLEAGFCKGWEDCCKIDGQKNVIAEAALSGEKMESTTHNPFF